MFWLKASVLLSVLTDVKPACSDLRWVFYGYEISVFWHEAGILLTQGKCVLTHGKCFSECAYWREVSVFWLEASVLLTLDHLSHTYNYTHYTLRVGVANVTCFYERFRHSNPLSSFPISHVGTQSRFSKEQQNDNLLPLCPSQALWLPWRRSREFSSVNTSKFWRRWKIQWRKTLRSGERPAG